MEESEDVVCPFCGETIRIWLDASAGDQEYVEDCQVCCRPMRLRVRFDAGGTPEVRAEPA